MCKNDWYHGDKKKEQNYLAFLQLQCLVHPKTSHIFLNGIFFGYESWSWKTSPFWLIWEKKLKHILNRKITFRGIKRPIVGGAMERWKPLRSTFISTDMQNSSSPPKNKERYTGDTLFNRIESSEDTSR